MFKLFKMILIAHRGNTAGPNQERENSPDYISETLSQGYYVEIDVWYNDEIVNSISPEHKRNGVLYLGHDFPQYLTTLEFLKHHHRIICHAKTISTFQYLLENNLHCFFHDKDAATLTSRNKIWLYPGTTLCRSGILVMPEWPSINYDDISGINISESAWKMFVFKASNLCYGVCSDYVEDIRALLKITV